MKRTGIIDPVWLATHGSASFRKLNPQLFGQAPVPAAPAERIRQDKKPLMNKLEESYLDQLRFFYPGAEILSQAIRLKIGNGCWYKPDHFVPSEKLFIECKGPHAFRGGFEALKIAASAHRWATFKLVWRVKGEWREQIVLP